MLYDCPFLFTLVEQTDPVDRGGANHAVRHPLDLALAQPPLMKCIGEAVHCWDAEYIQSKHEDIVRVVLAGLKDRTGDVRDASRLVLCLLYCKILPSNPSFIHDAELTEEQRGPPTEP